MWLCALPHFTQHRALNLLPQHGSTPPTLFSPCDSLGLYRTPALRSREPTLSSSSNDCSQLVTLVARAVTTFI